MLTRKFVTIFSVIATMFVTGCASTNDYQTAFSANTALKGNSESFELTTKQTVTASKVIMLKQGFTIDSVDMTSGMLKAHRVLVDPEDKDYSYQIEVSGLVHEESPTRTLMTLSANQKTIVHKEYTTYWKLLFILPLFPIETKYETTVVKQGNIEEASFYIDFFNAVKSQGQIIKEAEVKAAAEKAAAEAKAAEEARIAAAKAESERIARMKAEAEAKAKEAAEKAVAEKAAAEKAAAEVAAAEKTAAELALQKEQEETAKRIALERDAHIKAEATALSTKKISKRKK